VKERTRRLWAKQNQHTGDRQRLFSAVGSAVSASTVVYPGSYVDVATSFVFDDVTYVDVDRRADQFFGDRDGVEELIREHRATGPSPQWHFIHADYTSDLPIPADHGDLLVSLYAGFVSEYCTKNLRRGGHLLVNSSHGDAAMASIDPEYRLVGVVKSRGGKYTVTDRDLDGYMVPKRPVVITPESLHLSGRGVAYTKPAFAYLFQRLDP